MTAGERMFTKNYSLEHEEDDDDLAEYYGRAGGSKTKHQTPKSKSKSKSKDKNKDSSKRIQQLEKIYLQRL